MDNNHNGGRDNIPESSNLINLPNKNKVTISQNPPIHSVDSLLFKDPKDLFSQSESQPRSEPGSQSHSTHNLVLDERPRSEDSRTPLIDLNSSISNIFSSEEYKEFQKRHEYEEFQKIYTDIKNQIRNNDFTPESLISILYLLKNNIDHIQTELKNSPKSSKGLEEGIDYVPLKDQMQNRPAKLNALISFDSKERSKTYRKEFYIEYFNQLSVTLDNIVNNFHNNEYFVQILANQYNYANYTSKYDMESIIEDNLTKFRNNPIEKNILIFLSKITFNLSEMTEKDHIYDINIALFKLMDNQIRSLEHSKEKITSNAKTKEKLQMINEVIEKIKHEKKSILNNLISNTDIIQFIKHIVFPVANIAHEEKHETKQKVKSGLPDVRHHLNTHHKRSTDTTLEILSLVGSVIWPLKIVTGAVHASEHLSTENQLIILEAVFNLEINGSKVEIFNYVKELLTEMNERESEQIVANQDKANQDLSRKTRLSIGSISSTSPESSRTSESSPSPFPSSGFSSST